MKNPTEFRNCSGNKTLSDLTKEIVKYREQSRKEFSLQEQELHNMQSAISTIIQNQGNKLWESVICEQNIENTWSEIVQKSDKFYDRIKLFMSDTGLFYLAKSRADREYVNVGSVGVTQEGKSEFNASIARLDKRILPIGGGSKSCTTARINIINGASPDEKKEIVRVHYFSVNEFACQIYSFLVELGANEDEFSDLLKIETKEEIKKWASENRKSIEESSRIGQDDKGAKKVALLEYFEYLDDYVGRLGKPYKDYSIKELISGNANDRIRAEEYYSSVSYFMNPDDRNNKKYYSYATKKAEVFTLFKIGNEDPISNLQFLDTPGIGENKPGLDKILAKSVSSDLDVIVAVRAARSDVQSDTKRELLVRQLRTLLNKRPKSQNSLYFIQNFWDNAEIGSGTTEKKEIIRLLQITQNLDKINLDDSHFRTINILKDVEIREDGSTNSNYPIHSYLFEIFQQLIPQIKDIDREFFADAKKEFDDIKKEFNAIKDLMIAISHQLPSEDLQDQIDDLLKNVYKIWKVTCSRINDETINKQIHCDLEEFCDQKTGIVLSKLLKIEEEGIEDFDEYDESNYEFIEKFCKKHAAAINSYVDYSSWNAGDELKCYVELKSELLDKAKETIFSYIDVEKAQNELESAKKEIADVLRKEGKLAFVSEVDTWWQSMADLLESEKFPEELTSLFADFTSFSIDYQRILEDSIDKVKKDSRHADNFGAPDRYYFSDWAHAKMSIVHSLLCIENRIQSLVEENVYKQKLEEVVSKVSDYVNLLRELNSLGKQGEKTTLRKSWEHFYKKHAKEIFADNDQEKKQALISDWNKLCE